MLYQRKRLVYSLYSLIHLLYMNLMKLRSLHTPLLLLLCHFFQFMQPLINIFYAYLYRQY